ncbi:potassium channel family protein [Halalkalibacillus halophilus]|uniref:potassium channel family protein n=1 Tax=Halalkalibacillus halophilus TaxID=392827 RepID=UPI001FE0A294|nr:potassium channel family protein [Halalkalibacillus halophilus]
MKIKMKALYETLLFSMALLSVFLIWSDHGVSLYLDRIVWGIFVIDVLTRFIVSEKKLDYIKKNPFDIIAIIPLDAIFQLARFVRLFRVIRLLLIGRHFAQHFFNIIKTNGLDKLIGISVILIFISSVPILYTESSIETYQEAVWWSIVTSTTVGYGDLSPETALGRMIAVTLMFFGIGLIGMVTGSIATYFIKEDTSENETINYINAQLKHFENLSEDEIERIIYLLEDLKKEKLDKPSQLKTN